MNEYKSIIESSTNILASNYTSDGLKTFYDTLKKIPSESLLENASYLEEIKEGILFGIDVLENALVDGDLLLEHWNYVNTLESEYTRNDEYKDDINRYRKVIECITFLTDEEDEDAVELAHNNIPEPHERHVRILNQRVQSSDKPQDFKCDTNVIYSCYPAIINQCLKNIICESEKEIARRKEPCHNERECNFSYSAYRFVELPLRLLEIFIGNLNGVQLDSLRTHLIITKKKFIKYKADLCMDENIQFLTDFAFNLNSAIDTLSEYEIRYTKKVVSKLDEGIMEMQPQVGAKSTVRNDYGLTDSEKFIDAEESAFLDLVVNKAWIKYENMDETIMSDEEFMEESLNLAAILEGPITRAGKVAKGADKALNKVAMKATKVKRGAGTNLKTGFHGLARTGRRIAAVPGNMIDKAKARDEKKREERIIQGGIAGKLRKHFNILLKSGITTVLFNKYWGAFYLILKYATNGKKDYDAQQKIIQELQKELEIVEEKLEDAKSDGDRERKYQLMRIKGSLEKEISRIASGRSGKKNPELYRNA